MTTLYLKIDERNGIVCSNFRAYLDGSTGTGEASLSLEIVLAIIKKIEELYAEELASESNRKEARKLMDELEELYNASGDRGAMLLARLFVVAANQIGKQDAESASGVVDSEKAKETENDNRKE